MVHVGSEVELHNVLEKYADNLKDESKSLAYFSQDTHQTHNTHSTHSLSLSPMLLNLLLTKYVLNTVKKLLHIRKGVY